MTRNAWWRDYDGRLETLYARADARAMRRFSSTLRAGGSRDAGAYARWEQAETLVTRLERAILGPDHPAVRSGQAGLIRRAARLSLGLER